ncbi:MAG: hypothetical protein WBE91_01165 [Steroidobacteraceae bacterium]
MMRFLQWAFLIGCCLVLLIFAGPMVFLGVLGIAGLSMLIRQHCERLERRQSSGRNEPRDL